MFAISTRKSSLVLTAILLTCCSPLATTTAWAMDPPLVAKGPVVQQKSKGPLMDAIGLYEEKKTEAARLSFEKIASGGGTIAVVYLHKIDPKKYGSLFNDLPDYSKKLGKVHLDASLAYRDFKAASKNKKKEKFQNLVKMVDNKNTHALSLVIGMYDDNEDKIYVSSIRKSKQDFYKSYKPMTAGIFTPWDCFGGDYLCEYGKLIKPDSDVGNAFKMFETSYTKNPQNIQNFSKVLAGVYPSVILWTQLAIENVDPALCFNYAKSLYLDLKLPNDFSQMLPARASKPFSEHEKHYFDLSEYYLAHHLKVERFPLDKKENANDASVMLYNYATIYQNGFFGVNKDPKKEFFYLEKAADFGHKEIQYNYSKDLFDKGNLEKAFKYCALSANQGVIDAQIILASFYYRGQGCEKNSETAFQWTKKAADTGNSKGQYNCGACFEAGEGVPQNLERAFYYYTQATNNGYVLANVNLAVLYEHGRGCEKDLTKAFALYKEAADRGDPAGQFNVARLFHFGEAVPQDLEKAIVYYKMAECQGDLVAARNLASLLALMQENKSPESQAFDEAIFYNEKLANSHKIPIAEHNCSMLYYIKGGPENLKKTFHYSERAAQQGLAAAQNFYGSILCFENTEFYDLKKARHYFELAAAQGYTDALIRLNLLDELFTTTQSTATEDQSEFIEISVPLPEGSADSSDEEQGISTPVLPET